MGGYGSGRYSGKRTLDGGLTLDLGGLIRKQNVRPGWHVSGILTWTYTRSRKKMAEICYEANLTNNGASWIRLEYSINSTPMDYKVYLTSTPCNFGGIRWWWLCPSTGQKVSKLYLPSGGTIFAARSAHQLAYSSQREAGIDRTHARQARLFEKLRASDDRYNGYVPARPKGMHKRTYDRLTAQLRCAIEDHATVFTLRAMRTLGKVSNGDFIGPRPMFLARSDCRLP